VLVFCTDPALLLCSEVCRSSAKCRNILTAWAGFEIFNRLFKSWDGTSWQMSTAAANFWAGGIASNMYWFSALRKSPSMCLAFTDTTLSS
jgi:hypothetical protein